MWIPLFLGGQEIIERVEIRGNKRIPGETILYYFSLRAGSFFDAKAVEKGLEALWASGFFKDIKVAVDKGERGHVIILSLDEYPIVISYVFNTGNRIKERDILDRLRKKNIHLAPYSVCDPQKMRKIRIAVEEMLEEEGFNQGKVSFEAIEKGRFEVEVIFHVKEGKRYRIGEIVFEGNPELDRSILLSAFRNNKEHNLLSWIKGKDIFRKAKLVEDLESLKKKFREHGYVEARIGNPLIENFSTNTLFWGRQRMKKIVIPVEAGDRYFMGNIVIKGNHFFTSRQLDQLIHLEKGEIYNERIKNQAVKRIRELYQNAGYFFAQVLSAEYVDLQNRRVHVTLNILEGCKIFLNRLNITGNTFTKDKVIRREMLTLEKEKFRLDLFSKSLKKLSRSGIVGIQKYPEIQPDPGDPTKINVHL